MLVQRVAWHWLLSMYFLFCMGSFEAFPPRVISSKLTSRVIPASQHHHDLPLAQQELPSSSRRNVCCFIGTVVYIAD